MQISSIVFLMEISSLFTPKMMAFTFKLNNTFIKKNKEINLLYFNINFKRAYKKGKK